MKRHIPKILCSLIISALSPIAGVLHAQVVQLPSVGTFSIQTSVFVPDGGTMSLGGGGSSRYGSQYRGGLSPNRAVGGTVSSAGVSVRATVIDLDELDRMIRSQASNVSTAPNLDEMRSKVSKYSVAKPRGAKPIVGYDYMIAMNENGNRAETKSFSTDDTQYYLANAQLAREKGHWTLVELYYKLAWESLPANRKEIAWKALADAKDKSSNTLATPQAAPKSTR